jgi:ligand-binding SRPBCC domain-containing protein
MVFALIDMKYYEFKVKQFIKLPIEEVFNYFSNPSNLQKITPKYLNFKIKNQPPLKMNKGQFFQYQLRVRGIPINWTSLISSYHPPHSFIDEQIKGPYSSWHHTHTFKEENGGTSIFDEVKYSLPLGFIGGIINSIWVKRDLDSIFKYRRKMIEKTLKNISND